MVDFPTLLQQSTGSAWFFAPSAVLLGALHGLEPGHSKTMMAAFIIAVRGTIGQAVLLGLSAAFSHSLVIWALAALGLKFGEHWNAESTEPYFQVVSGVIIILTALWMAWRTRKDIKSEQEHVHYHDHGHDHEHHDEVLSGTEYQDDHEKEHALDIQKRFTAREVTTGQIVLFGLTGGLMPCPAALTVLLLCLQLKEFILGFSLVLCFSVGLAITLVASGTLAAWSVHHATKRFKGFSQLARRIPYFSGALLFCLGLYMIISGLGHLVK